jgi:hypothetical protein
MNSSPRHPAEIIPCKPEYSLRADLTVNAWLFVAVLISVSGDMFFARQIAGWPLAARCAVALAPLVAALLWIRSLRCWIEGMDELHGRITVAACAFATTGTLFLLTAWVALDKAGLFEAIDFLNRLSLGFGRVPAFWILTLVTVLFGAGYKFASRRYR